MKPFMRLLVVCMAFQAIVANANIGMEIAVKSDNNFSGWQGLEGDMKMSIIREEKDPHIRRMKVQSMEMEADGNRTIVLFKQPNDIKGTAFLTHSKKDGYDHQWIYLPSIKRLKRIATKNISSPFVGSDFAFEDMSSQEVEKYTYEFLYDKPCGKELTCHVVSRKPKNKHSGYTDQHVYYDVEHYRVIKIEYFDGADRPEKTLLNSEFEFRENHWRPLKSVMQNHAENGETHLEWQSISYDKSFREKDFNKNKLKRLR